MKEIVMCVPTYNHPNVVEDVLEKSLETYKKYNIDIYYFDSSEDEQTEKIIKKYQHLGYENLKYISVDSEIDAEEKMKIIFEGSKLLEEYKYIWPIKDRVWFPEDTICKMCTEVKENYDVIFIEAMKNCKSALNRDMLYDDPVQFYADWAWLTTSIDVLIYNKQTILKDYQVHKFKEKYPQKHNIFWGTYVHLFNELAKKIYRVKAVKAPIYNSSLGKSGWDKLTFMIWKNYWVPANEELPPCYDAYKEKVIKDATMLPWIIGSTSRLVYLHEQGVLTPDTFEDIIEDWEKVSDVPVGVVRKIAWGEFDLYHDLTIFQRDNNKSIAVLADLVEAIRSGNMTREQIPYTEIMRIINFEINEKKKYSTEKTAIVLGSVSDIGTYIFSQERTAEEIGNALQILVSMLLLM